MAIRKLPNREERMLCVHETRWDASNGELVYEPIQVNEDGPFKLIAYTLNWQQHDHRGVACGENPLRRCPTARSRRRPKVVPIRPKRPQKKGLP